MPFVRLEPNWFMDVKFSTGNDSGVTASSDAVVLWVAGLSYCNARLGDAPRAIDGKLSKRDLQKIALDFPMVDTAAAAAELCERRLWVAIDGGWEIVNYSKYQKTREQWDREREYRNRQQALFRSGDLTQLIKQRDGDMCRYCAQTVLWADKRGPRGATYDRVDPLGGNTLANVVIACRACNSSKGSRTPEAAGMTLLPPPNPTGPSSGGLNSDSTTYSNRYSNQANGTLRGPSPIDLDELRSRRLA